MHSTVYRMRYFVTFYDRTHAALADLIFEDSKPFAVLVWNDPKTRDKPLVTVPLDAADLTKSEDDGVDFIYLRQPGVS